MTHSLLPPHFLRISPRLFFDYDIAPNQRDTLMQLIHLAWDSPTRTTQPLDFHTLANFTHKRPGTLKGHLAALREKPDLLVVQPLGDGRFVLTFAEWLLPRPYAAKKSENSDFHVKEEEDLTDSLDSEQILLLNAQNPKIQKRSLPTQPPEPLESEAQAALAQRLQEAGVFPALLGEVFGSGRSLESLDALLEWCKTEQPESPAKLFMARLRLGAEAPPAFLNPPCPHCGLRSGHAPDCPARYISGEFSDFVEH